MLRIIVKGVCISFFTKIVILSIDLNGQITFKYSRLKKKIVINTKIDWTFLFTKLLSVETDSSYI